MKTAKLLAAALCVPFLGIDAAVASTGWLEGSRQAGLQDVPPPAPLPPVPVPVEPAPIEPAPIEPAPAEPIPDPAQDPQQEPPQPPVEPPAEKPPAEKPPTEQPPTENPPVETPPAVDPPVVDPPVVDPAAVDRVAPAPAPEKPAGGADAREGVVPAPDESLLPSAAEPASVVAILTRLTDPVAYLDAEARAEKTLFHWEKKHELREGDGWRQGVAGLSEIYFLDDASNIRCFGETHAFLSATQTEHRLKLHAVRRLLVEARTIPVVLDLPGGTTVTFSDTVLRFELDDRDHRWHIKNDGPGEVRLAGPLLPPGTAAVAAGHELDLPRLVAAPGDAPPTPSNSTRDVWAGRVVETTGDIRTIRRSNEIEFEGSGTASVGGARIVLNGSRVRVWKPRD